MRPALASMRLIPRTLRQIALVLIPVSILAGVFINYVIKGITYEETDEYLTYEMERVQRFYALNNALPSLHAVDEILPGVDIMEPFFKDTLFFEIGDDEWVPYRELYFSVESDGNPVGVVLRHLLLGKDDIARGSVYIVIGLLLLFSMTVLAVVNVSAERIWQPFFRTLEKLRTYNVKDAVPEFEVTNVDEFNRLNITLRQMLAKMSRDYSRTKEFNENAAHELQTYLSVIKTSNEELLNLLDPDSPAMVQAQKAYTASSRLSHIQKSLVLLSKIANTEFDDFKPVALHTLVEQILDDFREVIDLRDIQLQFDIQRMRVNMDHGLAVILISNLIKNAVKHNLDGGFIRVSLTNQKLCIANSGKPYTGDPALLLGRFTRGDEGNTGLGLAIVKQICEVHGFGISYTVSGEQHQISIRLRTD